MKIWPDQKTSAKSNTVRLRSLIDFHIVSKISGHFLYRYFPLPPFNMKSPINGIWPYQKTSVKSNRNYQSRLLCSESMLPCRCKRFPLYSPLSLPKPKRMLLSQPLVTKIQCVSKKFKITYLKSR